MIIDLNDYDLIKAITRKDAKAKHPNLPEGGAWRTIKGHHVYIKDGKVLAGAGVGKTGKPIKLTKKHLAEHQEHVNKEATKKGQQVKKATTASKANKSPTKVKGIESIPHKYHEVIHDYLGQDSLARKGITDAEASKGRCDAISEGLVNKLHEKGIPARLVEGQGLKTGLDDGAHQDWKDFAKEPTDLKFMGHTMVQVPEGIIDLSGAQFGKKYSGARFLSHDDLKKEWVGAKINYTRKQRESSSVDTSDRHQKLKPMKKAKTAEKTKVKADDTDTQVKEDGLVLFHGTKLVSVTNIMKNGFKTNGKEDDFGNAVYFKSPAFDHLDHQDHANWIRGRDEKGQPVPERYRTDRGNDTHTVTKLFTRGKEPAIIKAVIAKEHVLDCTQGRPKKLNSMITDFEKQLREGTTEAMMGFALKHILGMNVKGKNEDELYALYEENKKAIDKKWGSPLKVYHMSPYEVYAKKYGVGAIVDKLNAYTDEGWQIGVYDPKLIKIVDHGKGLNYGNSGVELIKALIKALRKVRNAGYCLMHHEMTDEGLIMHIGANDDRTEEANSQDELVKSLQDIRELMSWKKGGYR